MLPAKTTSTTAARRHGAQIVFRQVNAERWDASFVNAQGARDTYYVMDAPAIMSCYIVAHPASGGVTRYWLSTCGAAPQGRRYRTYGTLDRAQAAAIAWARRRFYIADSSKGQAS